MIPAMSTLADRLLPDQLWQRIQPLLPPLPSHARGGAPRRARPRLHGRDHLHGSYLHPVGAAAKELGCGSATTCWRRLDEWARAGVFDQLQLVLLDELGTAGRIDLERVSVDSFSLRAVKRGQLTGANPTDRGKARSKLHLAGERGGLPLAVILSSANANDSTMFEAVVDDIPPIRMPSGRRRRRPAKSTLTRPTIVAAAATICVGVGFAHGSPDAASSPPSGLVAIGGRSSAPARGWVGSGGCGSATTRTPSGSTRWCCWPAGSSASTRCAGRRGRRSPMPPTLEVAMDAGHPAARRIVGLAVTAITLDSSVQLHLGDQRNFALRIERDFELADAAGTTGCASRHSTTTCRPVWTSWAGLSTPPFRMWSPGGTARFACSCPMGWCCGLRLIKSVSPGRWPALSCNCPFRISGRRVPAGLRLERAPDGDDPEGK
jgi:transposase